MTKTFALLTLLLGFALAVMPNVDDGHGIRPRHYSDALAADAKEIIAAQIRRQGFPCDKPLSAEREPQHSASHETVWVLKCENASYRVRLITRLPARVERIDSSLGR